MVTRTVSRDEMSGLNRTKIGLKYLRDRHVIAALRGLNRTKIGLKFIRARGGGEPPAGFESD